MDAAIESVRVKLAELGRVIFERRLTDTAGGNLSARVGDLVCITPRYAGSKYNWQLRPEQVLVTDLDGNKLEGDGDISREAKAHMALYKAFPDGNSVFHVHAQNVLVFCAACQPIYPVLESTLKFGEVKVCEYAPAHSPQLAENIVAVVRGQEARIKTQAAAVIAPWHGLFVLGKDVEAAYDAAERIELNARCILQGQALRQPGGPDVFEQPRQALAAAVAQYKK
ncbi:MAG: hypothetical protein GYA17_13690 [Chloroflexi bacterium]|nr:hypothetical protein [Chloroflexota bacterium]